MSEHILKVTKALFLSVLVATVFSSCKQPVEKPSVDTDAYKQVVSDFYTSLAAIQADQALFAIEKMQLVADTYPEEAAALANLGVFAMRQGDFDKAAQHLKDALELTPKNSEITFLAGIMESRRGNVDQSITYLREAAKLDPSNIKITFALVEELERQDAVANQEEIFSLLNSITERQPENLAILLELVRTSVKWQNRSLLEESLNTLNEMSLEWPAEVQSQFQELKQAILEQESENLTFQLAFLRNSLNQLPQYQEDLDAVQLPPNQVGFLITEFTWLPQSNTAVATKDEQLAFNFSKFADQTDLELVRPLALSDREGSDWISLKASRAVINGEIELIFPGQPKSKNSVIPIDYDYDFLSDLVFAGSEGLKMYEQQEDSTFTEITNSLNLSNEVINRSYTGGWS
ncbi:MAG: tetratricopeptide repeat protein, partial [Candidatus Cyclobacteriaceae bacterium M2_1C_046]